MMRIGALLRRIDPGLLDRWYLAAGTALHVEGHKPHRREVAEALIGQLGLDPGLVGQALADPSTHDEVRADHDRVTGLGGWGVPTLVFGGGQALFGPVLIEPPSGEAAIRLWELLTGWLDFPNLYEVQRPKTPGRPAGHRRDLPALPGGQGLGDHPEGDSMTGLDGIRSALGQSYTAIENLCAVMSPAQWRVQSLCPDWTVRAVVGHLAGDRADAGRLAAGQRR